MNDSKLDSAVVARVLQVTRQSWMQPLAVHLPEPRALPVRRLSSRSLVVQGRLQQTRMPWGLQPSSRAAGMHGHG
jgi:hypothetical protein